MLETVEYRTLNHTSLSVSRLAFGTLTFGKSVDQPAATAIVNRLIDAGINFFDTANVYELGVAETMLGQALKGRRQEFIVASKVGYDMGPGPDESGLSRAAILRAVDASLTRLQTDYLDLYYLHRPDAHVPVEETMQVMEDLVRQGKVRYPATSNHASWQVVEMLWLARDRCYRPHHASQQMLNLLARGLEQEYTAMARRFGVSIITYNPLAGGLLSGRHQAGAIAPGSMLDRYAIYTGRYWHDSFLSAVARLSDIAAAAGRSLVSLALNWVLHHTAADCMILGASSLAQIDDSLRACSEGPLSPETLAACDQVWNDLRGPIPFYNR